MSKKSFLPAWSRNTPSAQPVSVRFAPENRGPSSKQARFIRHRRHFACFPSVGFPRTPFTRSGVCSIRKAAKPLTAALPYRRGEFTALSTVSTAPKGPFFFARLRRNGSTSTPVCMIFCHMFIYQKTGTSRFLPGLDNSRKSIIISNYSKLYY